jgi:hypothetical protein
LDAKKSAKGCVLLNSLLVDYLPWVISLATIYMIFLVGNKDIKGWVVSFFCQVLWTTFILASESWGLMPLNVAMYYLTVSNFIKWKKGVV